MADNTVWTMARYVTALRDGLRARPSTDLSPAANLGDEVDIMSAPMSRDDMEREAIVIVNVTAEEEPSAIRGESARHEEVYDVNGVVYVEVIGSKEEDAVEARDRATLLMGEVETYVRNTPDAGLNAIGSQVIRVAWVSRKELDQGFADGKRMAVIPWTILVKTRTSA